MTKLLLGVAAALAVLTATGCCLPLHHGYYDGGRHESGRRPPPRPPPDRWGR